MIPLRTVLLGSKICQQFFNYRGRHVKTFIGNSNVLGFSSSVMGNEANLLYTNTMQFPYKHNADGYMVFDIHGKLVVPPEGILIR